MTTIVHLIVRGTLDPELGALLWLLAGSGVPIHVAGGDAQSVAEVAAALEPLGRDAGTVTVGSGEGIEAVLRQPVPLRPASGGVLIIDDARVVAAHFHRPPLRDAAGHIRPQGPAVLATWDGRKGSWEHFAWGITPDLAAAAGIRAGDFEIELGRRREYLEGLAAAGESDPDRVLAALVAYGATRRTQ